MKIPFQIDLKGKTVVITGAGGVLCSSFAEALAETGAKIALLDLRFEAADAVAEKIRQSGKIAKAYGCNVLDRESLTEAKKAIDADLGPCDILINGAGGNNPKGTTTKEYLFPEDLDEATTKDITTFFDLDPKGIEFVFNLNFLGTLLPTQVFARDMAKRENPLILNISSMNAFRPLTKIPAYSGAKAAVSTESLHLAK